MALLTGDNGFLFLLSFKFIGYQHCGCFNLNFDRSLLSFLETVFGYYAHCPDVLLQQFNESSSFLHVRNSIETLKQIFPSLFRPLLKPKTAPTQSG